MAEASIDRREISDDRADFADEYARDAQREAAE